MLELVARAFFQTSSMGERKLFPSEVLKTYDLNGSCANSIDSKAIWMIGPDVIIPVGFRFAALDSFYSRI